MFTNTSDADWLLFTIVKYMARIGHSRRVNTEINTHSTSMNELTTHINILAFPTPMIVCVRVTFQSSFCLSIIPTTVFKVYRKCTLVYGMACQASIASTQQFNAILFSILYNPIRFYPLWSLPHCHHQHPCLQSHSVGLFVHIH